MRRLAVLVLIPAILLLGYSWNDLPSGDPEIWALDVGQGDAFLIRDRADTRILVDGGPGSAVLSELGDVLPWWSQRIDLVMVSHPDADHIEGLLGVVDRFQIGRIMITGVVDESPIYLQLLREIRERRIPVVFASEGQTWTLGDRTRVEVLWPPAARGRRVRETNESSIVAKVSLCRDGEIAHTSGTTTSPRLGDEGSSAITPNHENTKTPACDPATILLTGDADELVEGKLLKAGANVAVDVLKVSHHGSKSGSTEEFLRATGAKLALIGVGTGNSYGHPTDDVLARLANLGAKVLRTDRDGRIRVDLGNLEVMSESRVSTGSEISTLPEAPPSA